MKLKWLILPIKTLNPIKMWKIISVRKKYFSMDYFDTTDAEELIGEEEAILKPDIYKRYKWDEIKFKHERNKKAHFGE